jgi:hypothetical protein
MIGCPVAYHDHIFKQRIKAPFSYLTIVAFLASLVQFCHNTQTLTDGFPRSDRRGN